MNASRLKDVKDMLDWCFPTKGLYFYVSHMNE